jgi:hypothetical protein
MRTVGSVQPWFVANAVREPAAGTTDGQVENEVERYCEGASSAMGGHSMVGAYVGRKEPSCHGLPKGWGRRSLARRSTP